MLWPSTRLPGVCAKKKGFVPYGVGKHPFRVTTAFFAQRDRGWYWGTLVVMIIGFVTVLFTHP